MLKSLSKLAALLALSSGFICAKDIYFVNKVLIAQQSQEGKKVGTYVQKEVNAFQEEIQSKQKELAGMQEALNKKAAVLSKEAREQEKNKIAQKQKKIERELADREESLKSNIETQNKALSEKIDKAISAVCKRDKWPTVMDSNLPFVYNVDPEMDRSSVIVKELDAQLGTTKKASTKPIIKSA